MRAVAAGVVGCWEEEQGLLRRQSGGHGIKDARHNLLWLNGDACLLLQAGQLLGRKFFEKSGGR